MSDYTDGQRAMQERIAKRLDILAAEQETWDNYCAASVIRAEAAAVRGLRVSDRRAKRQDPKGLEP